MQLEIVREFVFATSIFLTTLFRTVLIIVQRALGDEEIARKFAVM